MQPLSWSTNKPYVSIHQHRFLLKFHINAHTHTTYFVVYICYITFLNVVTKRLMKSNLRRSPLKRLIPFRHCRENVAVELEAAGHIAHIVRKREILLL